MTQQPGGETSIERGAAEDASGAPLTGTEVQAGARPPSQPGSGGEADEADLITQDDGSGMAGGSSGGSGGGSGMPGHPDATR